MPIKRRRFDAHTKSLVHFDYPYYKEPYDGCRDEINGNIFTRNGNAKFVGTEIPNDEIVAETPRFGYRCLQTESVTDYITATNSTGAFTIDTTNDYDIECFVRITSSNFGNIISYYSAGTLKLSLSKDTSNKLTATSSDIQMSLTGKTALSLNAWHHVRLRMKSGNATLYLNGSSDATGTYIRNKNLGITEIRIGGIHGQIDEFLMKDSAESNVSVPSQPYRGSVNTLLTGGVGNGTANSIITSQQLLNGYAMIEAVSGTKLTLGMIVQEKFSVFAAGTEVMIHVTAKRTSEESLLGYYAFRRIVSVSGQTITIDKSVTEEFDLQNNVGRYYIQAVTVPNVDTLTINSGVEIYPLAYKDKWGGGIIALRSKGDITINGRLLSIRSGGPSWANPMGPKRTDKLQMTHGDLIDRFLIGSGGGIFISCGGILTATSDEARIGAYWPGTTVPTATPNTPGPFPGAEQLAACGGCGYGGAGGSDADEEGLGGNGGVGGGGGGGDGAYGGHAGGIGRAIKRDFRTAEAGTGGAAGQWMAQVATSGGIAGIRLNSEGTTEGSSGGGGAGGCAGRCGDNSLETPCGANVIIIARGLRVSQQALSTGGCGGFGGCECTGGGGTGFAYIACDWM